MSISYERQTPCALRVDLPSRQESGACLLSRKAALTFCAAWCEEWKVLSSSDCLSFFISYYTQEFCCPVPLQNGIFIQLNWRENVVQSFLKGIVLLSIILLSISVPRQEEDLPGFQTKSIAMPIGCRLADVISIWWSIFSRRQVTYFVILIKGAILTEKKKTKGSEWIDIFIDSPCCWMWASFLHPVENYHNYFFLKRCWLFLIEISRPFFTFCI